MSYWGGIECSIDRCTERDKRRDAIPFVIYEYDGWPFDNKLVTVQTQGTIREDYPGCFVCLPTVTVGTNSMTFNITTRESGPFASGYFTWSEYNDGPYACGYEVNNNNIELSFFTERGIRYY